jgi:hypothetical protein
VVYFNPVFWQFGGFGPKFYGIFVDFNRVFRQIGSFRLGVMVV